MISYVKSEWYRIVREKSFWIFIAAFAALAVAASVVLFVADSTTPEVEAFPYANTRFMLMNLSTAIIIPFIFLFQVSQVVVGEEIKHHTMKNSVSFGVSREVIYFGKWVISVIGVMVIAIISISISLAAMYLLLDNSGISYLIDFGWAMVGMIPLMMAGMTIYHFLYMISPSANFAMMIFVGVNFLPNIIGKYLGGRVEFLRWIYLHTPVYLITASDRNAENHLMMLGNSASGMVQCWTVGLVLTVIFLAAGYMKFKKADIK